MKLWKTFVLFVFLFTVSVPLAAKTLTLGVDVSERNPVIELESSANAAAAFARAEIMTLALGDHVRVRRFGARDASNMPGETMRIDRANRPAKIAATVSRYIAALPANTPEGDNSTNILAFLELGSFDCAGGERIVLFTDGVEASKTVSEKAFLSGKRLPSPPAGFLKGCEVVMLGLGQSVDGRFSPSLIKSIRQRWSDYFKAAGATFTAIIDP